MIAIKAVSIERLRRMLRLGPRAWFRVMRTVLIAGRIERSLRRETLDRTAQRFGAELSFDPPQEVATLLPLNEDESRDLGLALAVLRQKQFNGTCLRRALVMADILRDRSPKLRVGVSKASGEVVAHAWVEIDGFAIDPMAEREYAMLRPAVRA
ncbi:lasso peptide biosynthesis B2 protein [Planctomonas sp. JC2975]|uniref:lasso peptide biosynthesis B2 protein n=1 Tax=Planctomonas sp. JC2975 TaxID=2729626 RepID=UPI0014729169|nr:lasso peptide biosynthesis B2 protein [Planctomonas sp. JC2975]NNC11892.1 lasso peptide biosynthesis B2 protein [Planctomonas sp. JC2975]